MAITILTILAKYIQSARFKLQQDVFHVFPMNSWSNWTPNDSFGICWSWAFRNIPCMLNLIVPPLDCTMVNKVGWLSGRLWQVPRNYQTSQNKVDTRYHIHHMGPYAQQVDNESKENEWPQRDPRTRKPQREGTGPLQTRRKITSEIPLPFQTQHTSKIVTRKQATTSLAKNHRADHQQSACQDNQG